jgi:hypothetical protein
MSTIKTNQLAHTANGAATYTLPQTDGSAGQVLKTDGSGNLSWTTPSAGKILQLASTTKTDTFSTTSTSFVDITGTDQNGSGSIFCVKITPSASSSKIFVTGVLTFGGSDGEAYSYTFKLFRDSTPISIADAAGNRERATFGTQGFANADASETSSINFLDSPGDTSEHTYKVQVRAENPKTLYVNRGNEGDGDSAISPRFTSTITVMEVAA